MGQCASELATERPKRRVAAPAIGSRRSRRRMQQQALMAAVAGLVANQQNAPPADPRQLDDEPAANAVTPMGVRSENDEGAEQAETPVGADESSNERRSETAGRMDEVDPHLADAVNPLAALPLHHQRPVTPTKAESTRSSSIGHLGVQEGPEDGNDGDAAALEARKVEDDDKSSSAADGEGRRRSTLAKDDVGGYDDDDAPGRASSSGSSRLAFCGRASSMNDSFDSESLPHFAELEPAATRLLHSSTELVPYAPPRPSCRTAAMRDDTTTAATNVARTHSFKRQQEFLADAAVSSGLSSSVADRSSFLFDWLSSLDIGRSYATENDNSSTPISRPLTPRGGAAVAVVL